MHHWRRGQLRSREALGAARNYVLSDDVFLRNLALGEVMGIRSLHLSLAHAMRFAAALLALLAVPLYGIARLPFSEAARILTGLSVLALCCVGAVLCAWGFIRTWAMRISGDRRWGQAFLVLFLVDVIGSLIVVGLIHNATLGARVAVLLILGLLLSGGAWALGGLLQWLWRVTAPSQAPTRRSRMIRSRSLHGGVSRG